MYIESVHCGCIQKPCMACPLYFKLQHEQALNTVSWNLYSLQNEFEGGTVLIFNRLTLTLGILSSGSRKSNVCLISVLF